jgi:hypothetical protein
VTVASDGGLEVPVFPLRANVGRTSRVGEGTPTQAPRPELPTASSLARPRALVGLEGRAREPIAAATRDELDPSADQAARVATTLEVLAQLADSILERAGTSFAARSRDAAQTPGSRASHDDGPALPSLEAELLGSLGNAEGQPLAETMSSPAAPLAAPATTARELPLPPTPPTNGGGASPGTTIAAGAVGSPAASATGDGDGIDAAALAALVNDELVQQARRHGLELG